MKKPIILTSLAHEGRVGNPDAIIGPCLFPGFVRMCVKTNVTPYGDCDTVGCCIGAF